VRARERTVDWADSDETAPDREEGEDVGWGLTGIRLHIMGKRVRERTVGLG